MIVPPDNPAPVPRWAVVAEWTLVLGLAATLVWTTLCLGGVLGQTMVVTCWAVFGLVSLGAVIWTAGWTQRGRTFHLAVLLPVPFLLYALASVFWLAPAKWLAWGEWLLWFQMWLVFALALHFARNRAQTGLLVGTMVILGLIGTAMAAYQRFVDPMWIMLGRTQVSKFADRSAGMFGIPNSLAGLLELMVPVSLSLLFSRAVRPGVKVLLTWLAVLFIFAIVLTGSRGGWIGLGLALLFWPLAAGREWKRKILGTAAVLLFIGGGFWGLYHGSEYARGRIQPFLEGKYELSRPIIWKAGWQMWRESPWLGRGAASYNVLFEQYRASGFHNEPEWTHNDYLNTLSDYGCVGFVLWFGAGAALAWAGWRAVRRVRRETVLIGDLFALAKWKLGLFLGLLAYALHLVVDFHTKIPALAFLAAVVTAFLVRDEPSWHRPVRTKVAWVTGLGLAGCVLLLAWTIATPLYRSEALRYEARRSIDRYAVTGQGNLAEIALAAKSALTRAVRIDPSNGQAWGDLSYATVQSWQAGRGDLVTLGRFAELAADEALRQCPVQPEFWLRKAVALDVQRGRVETESCYRRAVELAPRSRMIWYHYAYHLMGFSERRSDALKALETCLALDPSYPPADTLRQRLSTDR